MGCFTLSLVIIIIKILSQCFKKTLTLFLCGESGITDRTTGHKLVGVVSWSRDDAELAVEGGELCQEAAAVD